MSFFLPGRLVELDYFKSTEKDPEYDELAKPYRREMDFAFFVVNFGYTKRDYLELTNLEKAFIYKAWESKKVSDSTLEYNAVFTANYNLNRKKGKRPLKLFRSVSKKVDKEVLDENRVIIKEIEKEEGKGWLELIYKANGLMRKK